jgi:hypothetical protein
LPATIRISVNTSTGTSPVQNFDHRKSFSEIGAVRMIQNAAPFRRHRREYEAHRHRRHHETGHREVEERIHVLQEPAHVRNALEIEDAEVVEVHHHQREQQQQLRPLADVTQEDLEILDQQVLRTCESGSRFAS